VHGITRAKVGGARDPALSAEEREAYEDWAARLSYAMVHRLWQLLLKGLDDVNRAPLPLEAAEMALLRVIHAADLPDPGQLARKIADGASIGTGAPAAPSAVAPEASAKAQAPESFISLIERLEAAGKYRVGQRLRDDVSLIRYGAGELVIHLAQPGDFLRDVKEALRDVGLGSLQVELSPQSGEPTLLQQQAEEEERERQAVLDSPMVKAAFEAFPEAELAGYTAAKGRS
jgi:DNA polymerase-3 subunit gamma/tau